MALLEVENVFAGYEGSNVLKGVSLTVDEGQVVSLLGRNGVGKSTTLRCIVGMVEVSAGSILFDGEEITNRPPHEAFERSIGFVTEDRGVFPDLTVDENLRIPIVDSADSRKIRSLYEYFPRLSEVRSTKGKHLSGGEQQMLAIARALRSDPRLLLLDEPSEGLAPQIVDDVRSVIEDIAAEGTTLLIVEQNVRFALDVTEYTYVMDDGQIVFEGDPEAVRENRAGIETHLGVHGG
ncbi:MAG: ABC transporter ATP-binding protein [Salinirussus sp.]